MAKPQWTPGRWRLRTDNVQRAGHAEIDSPTWWALAEVVIDRQDAGPERNQAPHNARLIVGAPDLYRGCEGLLSALDRAMDYIGNGYQPQDIVAEAREARDQAELFMARCRGETK